METGKHIRYSDEERAQLEDHLRLAERLGAETSVIQGDLSTAEDIMDFATGHNVTRIIIGKPVHPRLRAVHPGNLVLDDLVRLSTSIDILVIPGVETEPVKAKRAKAPRGPGPDAGPLPLGGGPRRP